MNADPVVSPAERLAEITADCEGIASKLCGFEDAWHMVRLACTNLLENVEIARSVSVCSFSYLSSAFP